MTDEQIIKALEHCTKDYRTCNTCPQVDNGIRRESACIYEMLKEGFALIKRQQTEIDRLKMLFNDQQEIIADLEWTVENEGFKHLGKMYSELRAEVIKEFADRLKAKGCELEETGGFLLETEDIDNLIKEMGC